MMEDVERAMCGVNEIEQAMATSRKVGRLEGNVLVDVNENSHENLNKNLHEQM